MAIKFHNPSSVSFSGKYSLGAEVPAGARLFHVSGQVGVDSSGKLQPTFAGQAAQEIAQLRAPAGVERSGGFVQ